MGKLISQLIILLLLYRYYKRMYGEWSSWHALFAAWNVITLLAAGVGTALFWEYRYRPAGHFMLYLYYLGLVTTVMYALLCAFVWLMLGSRLTEGGGARLTRYMYQMWAMGLCSSLLVERAAVDWPWWWRQESSKLLRWSALAQSANACGLCGTLVLVLVLGAVGCYDTLSFEGGGHWVYWQSGEQPQLVHCALACVLGGIVLRAYYVQYLLYGTIRDLDTGLVYRAGLRLTSPRRTVIHDVLYPMQIRSWAEWEARGPGYEEQLEYYELPANWYSYHHYAMDWDYAVNELRFYNYYYFNKRLIRKLARLYSKYKRLFEYSSENCMTHLYEEEDYGYMHYYLRGRAVASPRRLGRSLYPQAAERHFMYVLMLARAATLRMECHAFKLFFVQHARNYCLGLLDYLGFVLLYTTLGQHLSYVFGKRRPSVVWSVVLQAFLEQISLLQGMAVIWQLKGRRWRLYFWLRRLFVLYVGMSQSMLESRYVFVGMPRAHGFRRRKRRPCRHRRLARVSARGDVA